MTSLFSVAVNITSMFTAVQNAALGNEFDMVGDVGSASKKGIIFQKLCCVTKGITHQTQ